MQVQGKSVLLLAFAGGSSNGRREEGRGRGHNWMPGPLFPPCYFKKREAMQVVPQPRQGRPREEKAWARHVITSVKSKPTFVAHVFGLCLLPQL